MRLAVSLYGTRVGALQGDARTFDFTPSEVGIARFGMNSRVLSVSIPLTPVLRRGHANRRRNWFGELLPEGDQLDYMLAQGNLRRGDTLAFLARYGRDVAGALQFWDLGDPTEPQTPALKPLSDSDVRHLLEDPIGAPLANQGTLGKSSLGGVQPKIVLAQTKHGWSQALGGHPTTHILKPQLPGAHETVIFDEEYGARIARSLVLANFDTWIEDFAGLPTLVIERYDRANGERIHQEDFNQVLGAQGNEKYQEVGGIVSLKRIAEALRRNSLQPDLTVLAKMTILSVALGNLDMHAKNLGLLHLTNGDVRLAPAYDVVPQAHMNNDGKLALAVNKVYRHRDVTRQDLSAELKAWGLRHPDAVIEQTLGEIASAVDSEVPLPGADGGLQEEIAGFVRNLQEGRTVGLPLAG